MKTALSFELVNMYSSLADNMYLNYKWYWENLTDWTAATGFDSISLTLVPNQFNVGRGGAPRCTLAINTKYGSAQGYLNFLNDRGIKNVSSFNISAQAVLADMFESGAKFEDLFTILFDHADDASSELVGLNGKYLNVSPTPAIGALKANIGDSPEAFAAFADKAAECINKIGEMTAKKGIRTCVTNEFWTLARGNYIDNFFEKLNKEFVGYTASTAMLKIAGVDPLEKISQYFDNLGCVFLNDTSYVDTVDTYASTTPEYPQTGEQQRLYRDLGLGSIDFAAVYKMLRDKGFDGYVVLEPRYTTNVPRAVLRTRTFWTKLTKEV